MPKKNDTQNAAKLNKNDEFYTQYDDIQCEVNAYISFNPDTFRDKTILLPCDDPEWSNFTRFFAQNFEYLGLKKLISTSYATESKMKSEGVQLSVFDDGLRNKSPHFNGNISSKRGKIFTLSRRNKIDKVNINELQWKYLDGDGDFRSDEVKKLRDEADIIVTNPPFSLFTEFIPWIFEAKKSFLIIGNQNAITYKEVFPLIRDNKMWLGKGFKGNVGFFKSIYEDTAVAGEHREGMIRVSGVMWFTNLDHGRRNDHLSLMTMKENLMYSKHRIVRDKGYQKYENYDVIEVPFSDAIPSDYDGVMGVPITFLSKYNPEQFELIGMAEDNAKGFSGKEAKWDGKNRKCIVDGKAQYKRIFIKNLKNT